MSRIVAAPPLCAKRRGFSLLEMMVAMVFMAALILIVARILADVSDSWESARRRTETAAAARSMFDLIQRDMLTAVVTPDLPMVVTPSSLRFHALRPVADPENRAGFRTLVLIDYAHSNPSPSATTVGPMRRRQADWKVGESAPQANTTWEDLYPFVRAFRVQARAYPHQSVSGTLTEPPAYLDLYLEVASPDDQAVLSDMVAARRERVVQRFQVRAAPGRAAWGAPTP